MTEYSLSCVSTYSRGTRTGVFSAECFDLDIAHWIQRAIHPKETALVLLKIDITRLGLVCWAKNKRGFFRDRVVLIPAFSASSLGQRDCQFLGERRPLLRDATA